MKSYLLQLLVLFIVVAAFTTDGTAKDKHLPLPPQIVAAKTVYIDNQSGITKLGDRCYTEIQKWGSFSGCSRPQTGRSDSVALSS